MGFIQIDLALFSKASQADSHGLPRKINYKSSIPIITQIMDCLNLRTKMTNLS